MLHKLPSSSQLHLENPLSAPEAEADMSIDEINSPDANVFINIASKPTSSSIHLYPKSESFEFHSNKTLPGYLSSNCNGKTALFNAHFLLKKRINDSEFE
ncbi:hypothetical protein PanWU01x14_274540 [Parasponia andersonii]|uniref:Uncharacterized protein n=1 Tax=Parasponia andersonii TaxID=3476 RepID=A0A2P5B3I2_PARAD|nr:hypothetical protein PanWU01x14_274540 [Parasponia andersonii]